MEILLWLVPPLVVTVLAMLWVSWLGREGRGEVDRDVAVRRLAQAMAKERPQPGRSSLPVRERERSTGIAVRPSRASRTGGTGGTSGPGGTGETRRSA